MLFLFGYFYPALFPIAQLTVLGAGIFLIVDTLILFRIREPIKANRSIGNRLSNGDDNPVWINVQSFYPFKVLVQIIDEIPHQFQVRDFKLQVSLSNRENKSLKYELRPTERGEYYFGAIHIYAESTIGFIQRRTKIEQEVTVPVYPSFIQMQKFEMYAISNRLSDIGVKKIRRLGHTMEFDQIKEYVQGDDVRSINWKATARSQNLMVNQYQDEKSQQVINVIDMGRVMKMPFDGLTLLDYAINTSLVISNIALLKDDKAGLITFGNKNSIIVKPEKRRPHIRKIQEALYNLETNFLESDFERLVLNLKLHLNQRSLILLYTNFETFSAMERQLPYLQRVAKDHLLVTIFFENTEVGKLIEKDSSTIGDIYTKTIAEKFYYEKKQIVKALNQRGIHTIFTPPKELSVNAINKYLELKARGLI